MKFVAAAKLRRAQENVLAARPYAKQMMALLASAMSRIENPQHPLLVRRKEERILALVLTGDKGLCGAFNANVIRRAVEFGREHSGVSVMPIGKRGRDALRKRRATIVAEYVGLFARVKFADAKEIAARVMQMYTSGEVDAVYVIYNEFKSVLAQKLTVAKILPLDAAEFGPAAEREHHAGHGHAAAPTGTETRVDYIYVQPPAEILAKLLPRYVETQVYRVMLETAASFNAAQMTAMDAATNNAAELIDNLTLHMNKVRQAAITKEIIEVVSGAAAAQ